MRGENLVWITSLFSNLVMNTSLGASSLHEQASKQMDNHFLC